MGHDTIEAPVLRGLFVLENVLCQASFPAPNDVPPLEFDPVDRTKSTREIMEESHHQEPCRACHLLFDPLGFAFGHYDAVGAWRGQDGGKPVDAKVSIPVLGDEGESVEVDGAIELAEALVNSADTRRCVATQWFRYGFGRDADRADKCIVERFGKALVESDGNMRELLMTIVQSDTFRFRETVEN